MRPLTIIFVTTVLACWLSPQLRDYMGALLIVGLLFMVAALDCSAATVKRIEEVRCIEQPDSRLIWTVDMSRHLVFGRIASLPL